MSENKEEWKIHPHFSGYAVSNSGRVRNLKTGRILKASRNSYGYLHVGMPGKKKKSVHRLVMEAFHGESDLHVNHKNMNPRDNRIENLEYCTRSENIRHAISNGKKTGTIGVSHGSNKYSEDQILKVKELLVDKSHGHTSISRATGVSRDIVYLVSRNKVWKHLHV